MIESLRTLACALALLAGMGFAASQATGAAAAGQLVAAKVADAALAPSRVELLEVAFRAASALPLDPHVKNRSRAQEAVVATCLELDLPQRAERYAGGIENWRRITAYADVALHLARGDHKEEARRLLVLAEQAAQSHTDESLEWRSERARAKLASVHLWLGEDEQAAKLALGVGEAELGSLQSAQAERSADFDSQLAAILSAVKVGGFDPVRNALQACAQLFGRFYGDSERRALAEQTIKGSWGLLPIQVRIELLSELANGALAHADLDKARSLVDEAQALADGHAWLPEDRVPLMARLAGLRFRAGDVQQARCANDAALAHFEAERAKIVDIFRAGALRPVAETYAAMADRDAALRVYRTALDEGALNPNSRPRAEDLVATCCSMARSGLELDEDSLKRINALYLALKAPW